MHVSRPTIVIDLDIEHLYSPLYTVSKKVSHFMLDDNFGKCGPIFKILSQGDS